MRYYYKDKNGNYYNYKDEHDDLIAITEEEWNQHIAASEYIPNEKEIENAKRLQEINNLKMQLTSTDYKAIKYAEGLISEEDYATIKAERQQLRSLIKALEK